MRVTGFEPDVFRNEMRDGEKSTELEENLIETNDQFTTLVSVFSHCINATFLQLECVYVHLGLVPSHLCLQAVDGVCPHRACGPDAPHHHWGHLRRGPLRVYR